MGIQSKDSKDGKDGKEGKDGSDSLEMYNSASCRFGIFTGCEPLVSLPLLTLMGDLPGKEEFIISNAKYNFSLRR